MDLLRSALIVGLGSFFGGGLRFLTAALIDRRAQGAFPLGILIVNVSGSFAIGFAASAFLRLGLGKDSAAPLFLSVGLLGGYTTFSTFSMQTLRLLEGGHIGLAFANVAGSALGCVAAAYVGMRIGQAAFG